MSNDKAVLYDDEFGYFKPGQVFYPQSLRPVTEVLAELNREEIEHPKSFNANIRLYLDLIIGRFRSFHDTHRAAKEIYKEYQIENKQYCVYLRSFSLAGRQLGIEMHGERVVEQLGFVASDRDFRKFLKSSLSAGINSLSFINTFDLYPTGEDSAGDYMLQVTIPSFRVLSHNWKDVVEQVVRGAKFIVLNLQDSNAGVTYELELIRKSGLANRTIIAGKPPKELAASKEFYDIVYLEKDDLELNVGPGKQLAEAICSLCNDQFQQTIEVADLSNLDCWVVDRQIDLAGKFFDADTLAGIPYDLYIPSSLAENWTQLTTHFPEMIARWQAIETKMAERRQLTTDELSTALYSALRVFYVAVTLERYYEMAIALSTMGMAHRTITNDIEIMKACYEYAAECASWHGDADLTVFFTNAVKGLKREIAAKADRKV